jgi:glyoxylase-like metal-dependent hydrolase (beta-lactamase superfamily II)
MKIQQFVFNPFQENTYVIYTEVGEAMIVDPGCSSPSEDERLLKFILTNKLTVKTVVNTHLHIDHILGNGFIEKTFGIKAIANKADEPLLLDATGQAQMFGLSLKNSVPPLGGYIKEGDRLLLDNEVFEIFEVPGHSIGSIVLYNAQNHCLFAGDVLFENSIGRTDLPGGDYLTLIRGIINKLLVLPDETLVYCGHGPSTTIGHEKEFNPYL